MIKKSSLECACEILPVDIACALCRVNADIKPDIQEIRLRCRNHLSVTVKGKNYFLTAGGNLQSGCIKSIYVNEGHIEQTFLKSMHNSVHSFKREISMGSIVASGGNRVGFCGRAVADSNKNYSVENVKNITSINIRIAAEIKGVSENFFYEYMADKPKSVLVAGSPCSGKTTFLRDLTRLLGNKKRVALIDEKGEFACCVGNHAENDVGELTDIFTGYTKYEAIMMAVRNMNPEIIICDEIGGKDDLQSLEYCLDSGVRLCTSCHAGSIEQALERPTIKALAGRNAFDMGILLSSGENPGKITDVRMFRHD